MLYYLDVSMQVLYLHKLSQMRSAEASDARCIGLHLLRHYTHICNHQDTRQDNQNPQRMTNFSTNSRKTDGQIVKQSHDHHHHHHKKCTNNPHQDFIFSTVLALLQRRTFQLPSIPVEPQDCVHPP